MPITEFFKYIHKKKIKNIFLFYSIIFLSVLAKCFFFFYNTPLIGLDAREYIIVSKVIANEGWKFIYSDNPLIFWRLPLLPLLIFLFSNLKLFFIFQLLMTYVLAYNIFQIFLKVTTKKNIALIIALSTLFIPYINLSACAVLSESLQVFFIVFILKKLLYRQYDIYMYSVLTFLCFLRPESFTFVLFLIGREIYLKNFRNCIFLFIPLVFVFGWMLRMYIIFGSFSLVNPILSARAMIGSIYSQVYIVPAHEFHTKHVHYKGMDYVHNIEFINEYKKTVKAELTKYIKDNPVRYFAHRIKWITFSFSYIGGSFERFPDKNWKFHSESTWDEAKKINSYWSYRYLLSEKDYVRLIIRGLYSGTIAIIHFIGLFLILKNYRQNTLFLFLFLTFSYVFVIEAVTRYFITIQLMCFCFFIKWICEMKKIN